MGNITLKNVSKSFGSTVIIPGIDLVIENGEFVVFVGPSGCGKSTLLRLIAGLEDTTSGRIMIDGRDATALGPAQRGLAMVFQSYALYPHMTVRKNIAYPLKLAGVPSAEMDARVEEAAKMLQLDQLGPGLGPQLGVEVGQRLVHQEGHRSPDDGPGQRDPLALAAGELAGLAVEQGRQPELLGRLLDHRRPLLLRHLAGAEGELDVRPHGLVGVQRVALEHHRDVPVLRLHVVHRLAGDGDDALGRVLEAGEHPQQRRLAAARRAQEDEEVPVVDVQGQVAHGLDVAEALGHPIEVDVRHRSRTLASPR